MNAGDKVDENTGTSSVDENAGTSRSNRRQYMHERARPSLYDLCSKGNTALYASICLNNIKTQYGFSDNGATTIL